MASKAEDREEALKIMRDYLKPGDTVYTILRHVSSSGMSRVIGTVIVEGAAAYDVTHLTSRILGWPIHRTHYGVTVGGTGMDMGFHVVYSLSRALWPDGHPCEDGRDRCPSNDHSNGERTYSRELFHRDGGYALRHRWL